MWYMQEKPKIIWVPQHGYYTLNNLKQDVDPLFKNHIQMKKTILVYWYLIFSICLFCETGAHLTKKEVEVERKEAYVHCRPQ